MQFTTRRILATLVDMIIVSIPVSIISFVFGIFEWIMSFIPVLKWFKWIFHLGSSWFVLPYCLYEIIALALFHTTIGKLLFKVAVEEDNASMHMSLTSIIIRSVVKVLSFQFCAPLFLLISLYIMIKDPRKSLHDLAAGTTTWQM